MKRETIIAVGLLAVCSSFLVSCAAVQAPVIGSLYTGVQGPVAYGENGSSGKVGKACATSVLGIIAAGDASIHKAKENGGIEKVTSIDHSSTSLLGLFGQYCTIVHGE